MQLHLTTIPLAAIFSILCLVAGPSHGQDGAPVFTIDELVSRALAENPEIQFYESQIVASQADRRLAGRLGNPELDFEIGRKTSISEGFGAEGTAYAVSVVQPIEWPGRIGLRKAIADGDVQLARLGLERFKYHLASEIRQLAFRLSIAQERAALAESVATRFEDVREVLLQREVGGITPRLEIKAIEAATITTEKEALEAAIEMQRILLELNRLMGRRASTPLTVRRVRYDFPVPRELPTLMKQTLENNYEMHVRRAELAQQGFRVSLAQNERFPTINVGPYVAQEEAGEIEREAGVGFSLELPIFRNGKADIDRERAREVQAEALVEATARELEQQVAEASLIYRNAWKQLEVWGDKHQVELKDAAELADRHYRLGAVPVATYIEVQENYLGALSAIAEVEADALEAALRIEQLTGGMQVLTISGKDISTERRPLVARPVNP